MSGGEGDDVLRGGPGRDSLAGDRGADELIGGKGHDHARGGSGDDTFRMKDGVDDFIDGNQGTDRARVDKAGSTSSTTSSSSFSADPGLWCHRGPRARHSRCGPGRRASRLPVAS